MVILTRSAAIEAGVNRYYTGKPCKRGHLAERVTSTSTCIICKQEQERNAYSLDPTYRQQQYQQNRATVLQRQKLRYVAQRETILDYGRHWRLQNKTHTRQYMSDNLALYAFHAAKRRAALQRATPAWAEFEAIKLLYKEAATSGMDVDHIVPLTHPLVCGLHCIANLQLLTPEANRAKHNTFNVD